MNRILLSVGILALATTGYAQNSAITTVAPTPTQSWTASLKSELSSNIEAAKVNGGAGTETQLRFAYKFTDQAQLGLLLGGKYALLPEGALQDQEEMIASDVAIAGIVVLPSILGADRTEIDGRLYLPTSEASELAKQNVQVRADIKLPYALASQTAATLQVSPRVTDYQKSPTKLELVSQAKLSQGKTFAPYVALNHRTKMASDKTINRVEEMMGPEVGLEIAPHKMVRVSLSVSQERNILNPTAKKVRPEFSAFDTKETKYLMGAQIRL